MSTVIVQVGQCGNQIGRELWRQVLADKRSNKIVYVNGDGKLRCVQIDTEPKVIQQNIANLPSGSVRAGSVIHGKRGRGSNWALGYNGVASEAALLDDSLNCIRKEVERCQSFTGFIMLHSLSGGSGSGFGSRLVESLRDDYPLACQMSCTVLPHQLGEAPLQNYNALLCTTWLQRYCDCIVHFSNDEILHGFLKRKKSSPDTIVSMTQMNEHISSCLCNLIAPNDTISPKGQSIGIEPWEMTRYLASMPSLKFVHCNTIQKSKLTWDSLNNALLQSHQNYDKQGNPYYSLGNVVIGRGQAKNHFTDQSQKILAKIQSAYHCVSWNPYPVDTWLAKCCVSGAKDRASLTVASNYSSIVEKLEHIVDCAQQKYTARAYVHWYEKHGLEKDTFSEAFNEVETIIADYKDAIS